jgi:N-acetylmuramoyl-L-alanine amidase
MFRKLYDYSGRQQDLDDAVGIYRELIIAYPDHLLADDAQYMIGVILFEDKKDLPQAYVEFLKVDIKFPSGDMRPRARAMMDKLTVILSKKDSQKDKEKSPSSASKSTQVDNIRHWSTPNYTRVVIDLQSSIKYESHLLKEDPKLKKPRRLYVDLMGTYVSSDIESSIPIRDGLLKRARAAQHSKDTVRVVLDIDSIGGFKIFHLHDPFRIVVDVRGAQENHDKGTPSAMAKKREVRKGVRKVKRPDETISLARQLGLSVKRIVIDPGHGGKDPGTYLRGGIKEKQIVLKLANTLAKKIETNLGCEAILTREKDVFLPLERRTALANMKKADLFISLHVNAHKQKEVRGLETYFLNMATDERAVMVAARENATSEKNISDLQTILNDLMLNTKISESSKLAHEVQKGLLAQVKKRYRRVRDLGVKQAPFYVLIGAEMPAILVETGFITNPTERKRLLSNKYLEALADGIVAGMEGYIKGIDRSLKEGG